MGSMIFRNKQGIPFIQQKRKDFVKDKVEYIKESFDAFSKLKGDAELFTYVQLILSFFNKHKIYSSRTISFFVDLDIEYSIMKHFDIDSVLQREVREEFKAESIRSNNMINKVVEIISNTEA